MHVPFAISCIVWSVVLSALIIALKRQRRRSTAIRQRLNAMMDEEERMFTFLHDLGVAIENEPSTDMLSRIIVDGIEKVVRACGGAIYFLSPEHDFLNPSYISEHCPVLVTVPLDIRERAEGDPRALESYLRLSRVPAAEGILGHCLGGGEPFLIRNLGNHPTMLNPQNPYPDQVSLLLSPLRHANKDLGVLVVARHHSDGPFSANDFVVFRSAAEQSSFAIGNARIHREAHEKRALDSELQNAREVQRVLLPQADPIVPGFRISGTNLPARIISGDYYDYIHVAENRIGIVIADVSGKGVPAGLLMAMCRSSLRSHAPGELSPTVAMAAVNRQLFPDIREDMFISMAYSVLDSTHGTLTMARAGHDPALLYRRETGRVEQLRSPGLALGIDSGAVFERVTRDLELVMNPGDCVLFHTDGVREAVDSCEEEFGMDRMAEAFRLAAPLGAEAILERVQDELRKFTGEGPQMDDITLVAVEKR